MGVLLVRAQDGDEFAVGFGHAIIRAQLRVLAGALVALAGIVVDACAGCAGFFKRGLCSAAVVNGAAGASQPGLDFLVAIVNGAQEIGVCAEAVEGVFNGSQQFKIARSKCLRTKWRHAGNVGAVNGLHCFWTVARAHSSQGLTSLSCQSSLGGGQSCSRWQRRGRTEKRGARSG